MKAAEPMGVMPGLNFVVDEFAALLASLPPSRPLPKDLRIAKYADLDEGKRVIAQAAADGYASVCVPTSLYAALGRTLTPGRQVGDINGVRVVEDMYLRDGEIVAFPGVARG